jgi:hypothetical protein
MKNLVMIAFGVAFASLACGTSTNGTDGGSGTNISFNKTDGGKSGSPDGGGSGNPDGGGGNQGNGDAGSMSADAGLFDCFGLLNCSNTCMMGSSSALQTCEETCGADSTRNAITLYDDIGTCLDTACSETDGGPCSASSSQTACNICTSNAQNGGSCQPALETCIADTTGNAGDEAGTTCDTILNCVMAASCASASCQTACVTAGSSAAQQRYEIFQNCIFDQCSTADGGSCDPQGTQTCETCLGNAATGPCASQALGCQNN